MMTVGFNPSFPIVAGGVVCLYKVNSCVLLSKVCMIDMDLSQSIIAELKTQYEQRSSADAKRYSLALPDCEVGERYT